MKTMLSFRSLSKGIVAGVILTVCSQFSSFAQSTNTASKPVESLGETTTLQAAVYQIPGTTKVKIHFLNPSSKDVHLTLKTADNQVVYTEFAGEKKYIRKFDMKDLQDGMYYFQLSNGTQTITKEIALQTVSARNVAIQD